MYVLARARTRDFAWLCGSWVVMYVSKTPFDLFSPILDVAEAIFPSPLTYLISKYLMLRIHIWSNVRCEERYGK